MYLSKSVPVLTAICCVWLLGLSLASAQTAQPSLVEGAVAVDGAVLGDLGRIQERKLLAKAQLDLLELESKLKAEGLKTGQVEQSFAPTVKAVLGVGGALYATFVYPGDMTMDAKAGDVIAGGFTVESVSIDQVTLLTRTGEKLRLGFSATAPTPLPPAPVHGPSFGAPPGILAGGHTR